MAVRLSDRARGTGQDAAMVAGATVQSLAGLQELGDRGRALADTMAQIVGDGARARGIRHQAYLKIRQAGEQATALRAASQSIERSEEHTSELQSLMRISYAVFCLKKKNIY